jgi:thiol:disulfide interchange protein DsbD
MRHLLSAVAASGTARVLAVLLSALAPEMSFGQVQISLEAADVSAQPGKPTTVVAHLEHAPGWHTFWLNPGTGVPTTLRWTLPEGWKAGPIQWPTPTIIKNQAGEIAGNGYEGTLYLPVELTVPADTNVGTAHINVHAKWLMCSEGCIPGGGDATIDIQVSGNQVKANASVREAVVKQSWPKEKSDWNVHASRSGSTVILQIGGSRNVKALHFFSEDKLIRSDRPQEVNSDGTSLTLTLPIADKAPATDTLRGVLAYTDESGTYRGLEIRAPLSLTN